MTDAAVVATPETPVEDDFTAAFAQFSLPEKPAEAPAAVVETPAEPEKPVEPEKPSEPAPEVPAEPETPAEPTAAEQPEKDDLLERLANLVRQEQPKPEPAVQEAAPEPEVYTVDEQKFLTEYEKEWPDVARAESLRRRGEYRDLVNYVFTEIAKELTPLAQTMRTLAERSHLADLRGAVEDYDDVRDKVIDWAENQPAYLQSAYKQVIQHGTPEEISDLVARYKREVMPSGTTPATPKVETELPTPAKQAAAALAPVGSKRSAIVQADDPGDFDGAFDQALKALKQ